MRDAIVIGAGGGGAVIAKELAERGLDVLVLEAGPRHGDPEKEWSHLENDANNPVTGYFRWGPASRARSAWLRETPQNSFVWQLSGVGGTTQHFYGNCPRAYPGVFRGYKGADRDAYDRAHEFPFSYKKLVPYYEWVEHTLPVQTAPMGNKEMAWMRGASRMGVPLQTTKDVTRAVYRPQENSILQPGGTAGRASDAKKLVFPKARGCTFCGYCFQGCYEPRNAPRNLFAKRSTDNSYMPMALTAGRWKKGGKPITLITDAFATQIGTEGGEARTVTWRVGETGATATEDAKVVIMAGGCTENPRLWLNSGLPNPNDWVGRGYTDHYFDWVIGVLDTYTGSSKGPGSNVRMDYPGRGGLEQVGLPPALQAFSATFSDGGINDVYLNGYERVAGVEGQGRRVGTALKSLLSDVDRLLNVLVITDDDVEAQNRVTLSNVLPPDEHGAVPKIEFHARRRTKRTLENRAFMVQRAIELLRRAGAKQVYRINWAPLILHVQSTMRMGLDPTNSVLDTNCEARAVKRLFVADNSALPNSLGGPNPTLTSQALATRTAEKVFQLYFDGDPWVRRESPVSSINDRVTRAVIDAKL
jgi:choline dehydrogenase-like flavoprotein